MLPAAGFEKSTGRCVLVGREVGVWRVDLALFQPAVHGRPLFNGQAVEAEMIGGQVEGSAQAVLPGSQRLIREAVNQVEADVVEAGRASHRNGAIHSLKVMFPLEKGQFCLVGALHTKAEPVDADSAQGLQVGVVDGSGVGFERDFRAGEDLKAAANAFEDLR